MKYWKWILVVMILLTSGCGEPKIDASTDQSMRLSIEKVRESLPDDKSKLFNEAMLTVTIGANSHIDLSDINAKMKTKLHGKTGLQIIAEAEKIKNREN